MIPTQEQLDRLPKWARERIAKLQYERDSAVKQLEAMYDEQTPTDIWVSHIDYSTGGFKKGSNSSAALESRPNATECT